METLGTWLDSRGCSEARLWHRISKANRPYCVIPNFQSRGVLVPFIRRVLQRYFMALERAHTQSMFQALRIWELGKLRRVLCLRRRPNECWADHMKRAGPIVARQLATFATLAMRRVRISDWQMVGCPDDAKGRRYWEESVTWRCDEEWREGLHQTVQGGLS